MNESQRLRCLELATSLGVPPEQAMKYAEKFTQFTATGQFSTVNEDRLNVMGLQKT